MLNMNAASLELEMHVGMPQDINTHVIHGSVKSQCFGCVQLENLEREALLEGTLCSQFRKCAITQLWRLHARITHWNILDLPNHGWVTENLSVEGDDIIRLIEYSFPRLSKLQLRHITFIPPYIKTPNKSLTTLELYYCELPESFTDLQTNTNRLQEYGVSLTVLRFLYTKIDEEQLKFFSRFCTSLKHLELTGSGTGIGDDGLKSMIVPNQSSLQTLTVTVSPLTKPWKRITTRTVTLLHERCRKLVHVYIRHPDLESGSYHFLRQIDRSASKSHPS